MSLKIEIYLKFYWEDTAFMLTNELIPHVFGLCGVAHVLQYIESMTWLYSIKGIPNGFPCRIA
jgi:hypothetical protein